jgi:exosortase/archaeosortase family protein
MPPSAEAPPLFGWASSVVARNELFAGLVLLGFANGISERIIHALARDGFLTSLLQSFDISLLVWSACVISIAFLLRSPRQRVSLFDTAAALCAVAAFLFPIAPLSWLALSALAIYLLCGSDRGSELHRGAWIALAMTVPMFWGRLLFAALSDPILQADAVLIAAVVGTERVGNAIQLADGSGYLWIAPACSSLTNMSLAVLCWVMVSRVGNHASSLRDVCWVLAACSAVVAINVVRISLLGLYPEHFELIHGPVGLTVASWLILGATLGLCLLGVRHELPRHV